MSTLTVNYGKVLTTKDIQLIKDGQNFNEVLNAGIKAGKILYKADSLVGMQYRHNSKVTGYIDLGKYGIEQANAFKHRHFSQDEKQLLASLITFFGKDERIIENLLSMGFNYKKIFWLLRKVANNKKTYLSFHKNNPNGEICMSIPEITQILSNMNLYFGYIPYDLTLTKISQLVVCKQAIFKKIEDKTR